MKRNMTNLRAAARSARNLPTLSQAEIAKRWRLNADTVRKILKPLNLPPVPGPWKRARYAIQDIWRLEGIPQVQISDEALHAQLMEPLRTAGELAHQLGCDPATVRNWAREGHIPCARLQGSIRFHFFAVRRDPDAV